MNPCLSIETHGHSNAVVFHDGEGNKTVLITQDDEGVPGRYNEFVEHASELQGENLVEHLQSWVHGVCCEGRYDHWKAVLLDVLIHKSANK